MTEFVNMPAPTIGNVLRAARNQSALALREVAARADMDAGMLSKFENGHRIPNESQLRALAAVFDQAPEPWLALRASTEFRKQYGQTDYFDDCLQILNEDQVEYNKSNDPN